MEFTFTAEGRKFRNVLVLRSFVVALGNRFHYTYVLENLLADTRTLIRWIPDLLVAAATKDPQVSRFVRSTAVGPGIEVVGPVRISFQTDRPPVLGSFRVVFFEPKEGTAWADGPAEAYVPK